VTYTLSDPHPFPLRSILTRAAVVLTVLVLAGCSSGGSSTQPLAVWAWGANDLGQIGDGTRVDKPAPVRLPSLPDITAVKAGLAHSIALRSDGSVFRWGSYRRHVIGNTPCPVPGGPPDEHFYCWLQPGYLTELPPVRVIAAGNDFDLAIQKDGDSKLCRWGENDLAQLGAPTIGHIDNPVCELPVPDRILSLAAGGAHALALQSGPPGLKIWTWGRNDHWQLGRVASQTCGPTGLACGNAPDEVPDFHDVIAVAAGEAHSLALRTDGSVWAWGSAGQSQLGDPDVSTESRIPVEVRTADQGARPWPRLEKISDIAAGGRHSLALTDEGDVWAWGDDNFGQVGTATPNLITLQTFAVQVKGLDHVTEIAAGDDFSLALKSDGTVWAWGANTRGQLGATSTDTCGPTKASCSFTPIRVGSLAGVRHIAAGGNHALALARG
jgi:alpha-tubulin suppressor-like RCC1 family protein